MWCLHTAPWPCRSLATNCGHSLIDSHLLSYNLHFMFVKQYICMHASLSDGSLLYVYSNQFQLNLANLRFYLRLPLVVLKNIIVRHVIYAKNTQKALQMYYSCSWASQGQNNIGFYSLAGVHISCAIMPSKLWLNSNVQASLNIGCHNKYTKIILCTQVYSCTVTKMAQWHAHGGGGVFLVQHINTILPQKDFTRGSPKSSRFKF